MSFEFDALVKIDEQKLLNAFDTEGNRHRFE